MDPVHVFIDDAELLGWTELTLQRSKKELTGSLSISLFFNYVPGEPIAVNVTKNKTITVYIGGHLAFTGKVDKRQGSGVKSGQTGSDDNEGGGAGGQSRSVSIGAEEYTVKITARGKTKYLIDSSHQHPTTNILKPTNKDVFQKLLEPWNIELDWKATDIKLDKIRLRDGAKVVDELHRISSENGHFIYETCDGKLRITDDTGRKEGEPLILGENVLTFSAEQGEDEAKSKVKVKGQRTDKKVRGEAAVLNIEKELKDSWVEGELPFIIQHYGDGTPEALERRANFETNKRSSESKKLTINVFHVQSSNGDPWDIGTIHYCEIPPEGIYDVFECTELTYSVQNDKKIQTTMTLSPMPRSNASIPTSETVVEVGLLDGLSDLVSGAVSAIGDAVDFVGGLVSFAASRRAAAGITFSPGSYPAPWGPPDISVVLPQPSDFAEAARPILSDLVATIDTPVATLPADYQTRKVD